MERGVLSLGPGAPLSGPGERSGVRDDESAAAPEPKPPVRRAARARSWRGFDSPFAIAVAIVLVVGPLVVVLGSAFGFVDVLLDQPVGLDNFRVVLDSSSFVADVAHTYLLAGLGALGAVVVGTTLAFLVTRTNMPGAQSRLFNVIPLLSFLLPTLLVFFSWHVLYASRAGLVNIFLRWISAGDVNGGEGPLDVLQVQWLIVAMVVLLIPLVFLTVRSALAAASPELEQAARLSGASLARVVRTVTLPMIRHAIGAALLLVLVIGTGVYIIPALFRVPEFGTVSLDIKARSLDVPANYGQASAWALFLLLGSLLALGIRNFVSREPAMAMPLRQSMATEEYKRLDIGRWRWAGLGLFVGYAIFAAVLPLLAVLELSFRGFWGTTFRASDFNLDNYRNLEMQSPDAFSGLTNSVVLAVLGATIGVIIGVWFARAIARGGQRAQFLEAATFMPAAIPPIIIGLSLLLFTVRYMSDLFGTIVPVLIVYLILTLPFAVQIPLAGLRRVPRELEWASAVCGGSRTRTIRSIVLPLIRTDLVAAWILLAVIMVRELDASIMLQQVNLKLAGPTMFDLWDRGLATSAAAYGVYILLVTLALVLAGVVVAGAVSAVSRVFTNRRLARAAAVVHERQRSTGDGERGD